MKRLLLVVDEAVADIEALPADVCERLEQFDEIRVVVPALNSRLSSWVSDIDGAVAEAETRLRRVLRQLGDAGLAARGEVGDEDPAQAATDVLHAYAADQIVLVHHSEEFERYKEHDLLRAFAPTTPDRSTASRWIAPAKSLLTSRRRGDNRAASTDAVNIAGRLLRSHPRLREDRRRSPGQDRLGSCLFGAG